MKIVIAGAGEVGSHLAKLLSNENQDIIIVDNDESRLMSLEQYNLMTYKGSPTSFKILKAVDIESTDLFIAVTPYEARNITACFIAKKLGAKKTVARIDNYEYLQPKEKDYFLSVGVDELIYPEFLASEEMITALKRSWVRNWFELCNNELIVIGVKLHNNAKITGMQIKDLSSISKYIHISAIKRDHETIIPRGSDIIKINDIIYFVTKPQYVDDVRDLCGKTEAEINKIMIMGGSKIAVQLAKMTDNKYRIKIIDNDLGNCNELAQKLPDANIIHGDGRDVDLLLDEGIQDYDAFIALSDSSETNILGCLTAKELGVKKTIADVETIQFISEAENLNIGTIINKKLLASSKIFQILLDSDSSNAKCLALADAEVAELIAKKGSKITKSEVRNLSLSSDMTIGGLTRNGIGMLVEGNTKIEPGDHVVIFCLNGAIHKVEKLFN